MQERDLTEANRILKLAFGTAAGLEDPEDFMRGADFVSSRWHMDATAAFVAEHNHCLLGSNFATNWGSFGFFGPLSVHPEYWGRKIAQALLEPVMSRFDRWGIEHRGLYTAPDSPKHIHLYEKYGFSAGHLTAILTKAVSHKSGVACQRYSALSSSEQEAAVKACGLLTDKILPGLDVRREILAVAEQGLGETGLIYDDNGLATFAICHCGPGSEAGDDLCYVKFGAVRPDRDAGKNFHGLLLACEAIAVEHGLGNLSAGVNMNRRLAYRQLKESGYRNTLIGVAMETYPEKSYNREDTYIMDDWR